MLPVALVYPATSAAFDPSRLMQEVDFSKHSHLRHSLLGAESRVGCRAVNTPTPCYCGVARWLIAHRSTYLSVPCSRWLSQNVVNATTLAHRGGR